MVLKSASDPAVREKADALLGKDDPGAKAPHPRVGKDTGVKASDVKEEDDPGAKAHHGNSSDEEDDEQLGARLRSASQVAMGSRDAVRQPSEARSDKAARDEEERRSSVHLSRAVLKEKRRAGKASGSQVEKPEEPAKRKHKSKHGSKKEAKRATKSRRSQEEPDEDWDFDLGDEVPDDKLRETLSRMSRVTKGLRASSEKADSAVSQMSNLMTKMGKQQRAWEKARNSERDWLQEENRLLKDGLGWKKRRPQSRERSPPRSDPEEDETDSLEEDEPEEGDPDF